MDRVARGVDAPAAEDETSVAPAKLHDVAGAGMAERELAEVLDRVALARPVERLRHRDVLVRPDDVLVARAARGVVDVAGGNRRYREERQERRQGHDRCRYYRVCLSASP